MDSFLDSVSRKGRKVKERLRGKKGKRDKTEANTAEESIESSSSFLRPVSHIAAGGHGGEGTRASTDTRRVHSRARSPQPEPVPVGGKDDDGKGKEVDTSKKEVDQGSSVETAVGGRPGLAEAKPLSPSPSTPIPHSGEPESTWTCLFHLLNLIVLSDNTEASAAPDQVPEAARPNESAEPGPATSEEKSNWMSTAVSTAKLLLRGVRDAADAFGPLKSVAGGLCFILDNYEVRPSSPIRHQQRLRVSQQTKANVQAVGSLAPRVEALAGLLYEPVPDDDVKEATRREKLER